MREGHGIHDTQRSTRMLSSRKNCHPEKLSTNGITLLGDIEEGPSAPAPVPPTTHTHTHTVFLYLILPIFFTVFFHCLASGDQIVLILFYLF
jgi:hypothetical protein